MAETDFRLYAVPDYYVVSFKRRHSGRLLHIEVEASGISHASRLARALVVDDRYREYGISKLVKALTRSMEYSASGIFETWWYEKLGMRQYVEKREVAHG